MRGEVQAERRTMGLAVPEDGEGDRVRDAWRDVDPHSDSRLAALARHVCADESLWGTDLSALNGFAELVSDHLARIVRQGIRSALDAHLTEPATT
jgi:hypothetical protein